MPTVSWTGATNGNFGTATNYTGGVAPAAGDDWYAKPGSVSINAGLATGLTGANALVNVTVGESYTGSIGSSGNYLVFDATTIAFKGGSQTANAYLNADATDVICDSINRNAHAFHIKPRSTAVTRFTMVKGTAQVDTGTCTTIDVGASNAPNSDIKLLVNTSVTTTTMNVWSGEVFLDSGQTTLNMYGGTILQTTGSPTTLNAYAGRYIHKTTSTITTLVGRGTSYLDFSQFEDDLTITTVRLYDNCILDLRCSRFDRFTFTNKVAIYGSSVQVLWPSGATPNFA